MKNTLLEAIEYKIEETPGGTWRSFGYEHGGVYREYTSKRRLFGLPLLHFTYGLNPETGRRKVARGIFAVGRLAVGWVAIGHASMGLIAIGQLGLGALLGLGQASSGVVAVGQLALGLSFGLGQIVTGYTAIGQFGIANWLLAQGGIAEHAWTAKIQDPAAVEYFRNLPVLKWILQSTQATP